MSKIPEHSIEEVRDSADIVDVVGDYVRLKKRGSSFVGLCPFHSEKTPSFNVNPRLGIFKCFGCGEGGDVFSFLSRVEGLSFPESVRLLAEQTGVTLPKDEGPDEDGSEVDAIYHALRYAARFYFERLGSDDARLARDYLEERGFLRETVKTFGIGYAPASWDALLKAATADHISEEILEKAGLIIPRKSGEGYYDRYRNRLIFPIFSHVGKVLGFGGRVLDPEDEPKYINSPETRVYNKRGVLYGLYHGKNAIRGKEEAVLVEGYTDVVSLHQAGVEHVVASSGTALTEDQIGMLGRYANRIVLLYDADAAGLRAALRGIDLILAVGLIPYAVSLPDGEDPDSFVRAHGGEAFEKFLAEERKDFVAFILSHARAAGRMETPEGQASVQRAVLRSISQIEDTLVRESYLRRASESLRMPENQLRTVLDTIRGKDRSRKRRKTNRSQSRMSQLRDVPEPAGTAAGPTDDQQWRSPIPAEKTLIRLMLERGAPMIEWIMGHTAVSEFTEGPAREVADELVRQYEADQVDIKGFLNGTFGDDVRRLTSEVLTVSEEPSENWLRKAGVTVPKLNENPQEAAVSAMVYLKTRRVQEKIDAVSQLIGQKESAGQDVSELKSDYSRLLRMRTMIKERKFLESV